MGTNKHDEFKKLVEEGGYSVSIVGFEPIPEPLTAEEQADADALHVEFLKRVRENIRKKKMDK